MQDGTEEIKEIIYEQISKTEESITQYEDMAKPVAPENSIGRVSRMDAINNKSVNDAALRKAETKLNGLKSALDRLQDSDFGLCVRCNNEIPLGRILLMPHARTCVNCAR